MITLGLGAATLVVVGFNYVRDELLRPKEGRNSVEASCAASAPEPQTTIERSNFLSNRDRFYTVKFHACDIVEAYIACAGEAATVASPTITRTPEGYRLTRPSQKCGLTYTTDEHRYSLRY